MSHELDDNIEWRKQIVQMIPTKGMSPHEFLKLVASFGYNIRGSQAKVKELRFLGLIEEREGRVYAHK